MLVHFIVHFHLELFGFNLINRWSWLLKFDGLASAFLLVLIVLWLGLLLLGGVLALIALGNCFLIASSSVFLDVFFSLLATLDAGLDAVVDSFTEWVLGAETFLVAAALFTPVLASELVVASGVVPFVLVPCLEVIDLFFFLGCGGFLHTTEEVMDFFQLCLVLLEDGLVLFLVNLVNLGIGAALEGLKHVHGIIHDLVQVASFQLRDQCFIVDVSIIEVGIGLLVNLLVDFGIDLSLCLSVRVSMNLNIGCAQVTKLRSVMFAYPLVWVFLVDLDALGTGEQG